MDPELEVSPLNADPARQAIGPQRGYRYQAWQSVYQWVNLKPHETLFLEGAEDIDRLKRGEATAIQVKETNAVVTLNSADVIAAIGHFWEHQTKNLDRTVRLHFLTTSSRGHEQSKPFGKVKGLDLWDAAKRPDAEITPLREFLKTKTEFPTELLQFLNVASDDELREKLVQRIVWDTDSDSQSYLRKVIEDHLVEVGYRTHSLPASESKKVLPHLFTRVWDIVCDEENRQLNYSDFLRLFEDVTTKSISALELKQLRQAAQIVQRGNPASLAQGSGAVNLIESTYDLLSSPLERLTQRAALVENLQPILSAHGFLFLRGSTSVGKSTLAKLVIAQSGSQWQQLNFRGAIAAEIRDRLAFAALTANDDAAHPRDYLIDDLNFDIPDLYENEFAALIYVVRQRGGRIVVTSQGELPSRVRLLFDFPEVCSCDVPLLTESEIQELAQLYGCLPGKKLESWSKLIFANTGGHPLLAHAEIKNLQFDGWPNPTVVNLTPPETVKDIRREARRRFRDLLPSEDARTLAYRLSVFVGQFRKSNALYLAEYPTKISNPGEAFERLVGPWLERASEEYYVLSPLLAESADEMLPGGAKALQPYAAMSYLKDLTWTQTELWGVLFHGILGEALPALMMAIAGSFQIQPEHWPLMSRQLEFVCFFKVLPGDRLIATDSFVSLLLRWLQFRIAAEVNPSEIAPIVVERWAEEVNEFTGEGAFPGSEILARLTFAILTLSDLDVPLTITRVVINLGMALFSLREGLSKQADNPLLQQTVGNFAETLGEESVYLAIAINRCKSLAAVSEFLSTLIRLPPHEADLIWTQLRTDDHQAMLLVDSAWLAESKSQTPNWSECLETFENIARLAIEHGSTSLIAAAYRGQAIVYREYLNDSTKAHWALDNGEKELGQQHSILEDYRAKIFSLDGEPEKAISIWRSIESRLEETKNPWRAFVYRDAEIAAAGINDWASVAEFAMKGEQAARDANFNQALAIGFHADYALALWRIDDRAASIQSFIRVVSEIVKTGAIESDAVVYTLWRKVAATVGWLKQEIMGIGSTKYDVPSAAVFSDQSSTIENTKADPEANLWYGLAEVEFACAAGDEAFKNFERTAPKEPLQQAAVAKLRLSHVLREQPIPGALVSELADFYKHVNTAGESFGRTDIPEWTSYGEMVQPFLFAGLTVALSKRTYPDNVVISKWRETAQSTRLTHPVLTNWLDHLEKWGEVDESELAIVIRDANEKTEIRILAALLLSAREDTSPENLFYSNVALLTTPNIFGLWGDEIQDQLAQLIAEAWLRAIEHQRFALRSPNLTIPAIVDACSGELKGFRKAATIILAARTAVSTGMDESLARKLIEMRDNTGVER
jgi:hypothetical protein